MNSFAQNINYIAGLDNVYGSKVELYKNNLSLKNVEHDIELKFSYYNNDDKKIHSIIHSEPGVLVGKINDVLLSFKSLVDAAISGSEFTCTVSSGVQNFVVNNVVMISIAIDSHNDTYKAYELEAKVTTAGAVTYDVFGEVSDTLKILPSLAMITSSDIDVMTNVYEIKDNVNTVATNIVGLNSIVSNMEEILSADENAAIAAAKASEANNSAAAALQSSIDAEASAIIAVDHIADKNNPHEVTKSQVGLGNVDNTTDANKVVLSASKLTTARTITIAGDASGSANFDGSANTTITIAVADDSHNHAFGNLTGKPTTVAGYGITDVYTKTQTDSNISTAVAGLVSSAPATLDTLNELANALGNDVNFATTVSTSIGTKVTKNADIVSGTNTKITYDAKGLVTGGTSLAAIDIPALDWSKITTGKPTTLSGYGISDAVPSSHIGTTGASHGVATTSVNGFMSSADKTKLDGVATNANNYAHPISGVVAGTYTKITVDSNGHAIAGSIPTTLAGYSIGDAYTKTESNTALALKTNKSDTDSVNMLRADKFLAAQNIANMVYTAGDLTKIQYKNATDVDYEILNYSGGNLVSINHYVTGVLKGTTTLSYSSGNLVSAVFA